MSNLNGIIVDESRDKKVRSFFNFGPEASARLEKVTDLMPEMMQPMHGKIIHRFLNKERDINTKEKKEFLSFGRDAQNFLFPLKIFPRISLEVKKDFRMLAALLKLDNFKKYLKNKYIRIF